MLNNILSAQVRQVRSHRDVFKNAVYYSHAWNGPETECETDTLHPPQTPYWWHSRSVANGVNGAYVNIHELHNVCLATMNILIRL